MAGCLTIIAGAVSVDATPSVSCTGWFVLDSYEYETLVQPNGLSRQENFQDGLTVGWGVAAVMVAAFCWLQMRRAAR